MLSHEHHNHRRFGVEKKLRVVKVATLILLRTASFAACPGDDIAMITASLTSSAKSVDSQMVAVLPEKPRIRGM